MLMDTVREIHATTKDARYLVPGAFALCASRRQS
jgi:hypothetical protein